MFIISDPGVEQVVAKEGGLDSLQLHSDLKSFCPSSKEMFSDSGHRIMFYADQTKITFQETQAIINFKIFTKVRGKKIPDKDQEILKHF